MVALVQIDLTGEQVKQCRALAQVLSLTKQMLSDAENGEWERVAEREVVRRADLAACFSNAAPLADVELIAQAMAAVLHLNDELMAKLKIARGEVMVQGREHTHNLNAVGSYQAVDAAL